ncbi:MAG TPA: hypothetical protein P5096_03930 [Patescibacteria group bacterium]|nr:hypothetical protein [Patescibacteria group bacterium]
MKLDNIFGKPKQSKSENKFGLEEKSGDKIDVKELVKGLLMNDGKRKSYIAALNKAGTMIENAKNDLGQKNEWDSFFIPLGFKDITELGMIIKIFAEILEKKDFLKALGQFDNIKKVAENFNQINTFLAERGLNLAKAI